MEREKRFVRKFLFVKVIKPEYFHYFVIVHRYVSMIAAFKIRTAVLVLYVLFVIYQRCNITVNKLALVVVISCP